LCSNISRSQLTSRRSLFRGGIKLKRMLVVWWLCALTIVDASSQGRDFSRRTGPYLGEPPPGKTPTLFGANFISTGLQEGPCTFMPSGDECVFMVSYRKPHSHTGFASLARSKVVNGRWSAPEFLPFSGGGFMDIYPFISYDGKELFFASSRPTGSAELKNQVNLWRSRRVNDAWSDPEVLPFPINGRGDVSGPSLSLGGRFYFTLASDSGSAIYESTYRDGRFGEPRKLPESINTKEGPFDGVVSPDGSYYIVCVYNRADSFGGTDLYVSFRLDDDHWTPLKTLGAGVNSRLNEGSAIISPDGKYVFFSGCLVSHGFYEDNITYSGVLNNALKPQYGSSDIYWVSAEIIEEFRPKE
jgi:hypothetical protein